MTKLQLPSNLKFPAIRTCPVSLAGLSRAARGGRLVGATHMCPCAGLDPASPALRSTVPFVPYAPGIYEGISVLAAHDRLIALRGITLLWGGEEVGLLSHTPKQFAVVAEKLCIFPDRLYLDLTEGPPTLHDMGPDVPAMDFICAAGNRLFGCRNADGTVFASAAGDPCTFTVPSAPTASSPWRTRVSCPGPFTACAAVGAAVLFFKQTAICKIMGSAGAGAGSFGVVTYAAPGVTPGAHGALCVREGTAYYPGPGGIYRFAGNVPENISADLFRPRPGVPRGFLPTAAVMTPAGQYLCAGKDATGAHRLFGYDTVGNVWWSEDGEHVVSFAAVGDTVWYLGDDGHVFVRADAPADTLFSATFSSPLRASNGAFPRDNGAKRLWGVTLRAVAAPGTTLGLYLHRPGDVWSLVSSYTFAGGASAPAVTVRFPLPPLLPEEGDVFLWRLSGQGQCCLLDASVTFEE